MNAFFSLFESLDDLPRRLIYLAGLIILILLVNLIMRKIVLGILRRIISKTPQTWDDTLMKQKVFTRLVSYVPAVIIYLLLPLIFPSGDLLLILQRLILAYMIAISVLFLNSLLDSINVIYQTYKISRSRPIKGFMQVLRIVVYLVGVVLMVSTLIDRSPLGIFSGIGALSAILILVFKDSILGLISSIQLSANNQVSIGDWIEVPQFGADGDVIDISLQSVMVQNWDKTIVTLPTYALVTSGFKNWRGMMESGGRRIKRALAIDLNSIRFFDDDDLKRMEEIPLLRDYLRQKRQELEEHNRSDRGIVRRRLTNVGTFRAYIAAYLKFHPHIHNSDDMTFLIRQLPPGSEGLPIEIYVFSREQDWAVYESIQADVFDHLLSVLSEFSLAPYQHPGSYDFRIRTPRKDAGE